ncbi:MAG: hypothetical protein AAGE85_08920 [Pseudomonadota bacterium]
MGSTWVRLSYLTADNNNFAIAGVFFLTAATPGSLLPTQAALASPGVLFGALAIAVYPAGAVKP